MDNEFELEDMNIDFDLSDEDRKINIEDENGIVKEYEVIANVTTEDGEFIVYTDNKELSDGQVLLYINSIIRDEDGNMTFDEVEDLEAHAIINEIRERLV